MSKINQSFNVEAVVMLYTTRCIIHVIKLAVKPLANIVYAIIIFIELFYQCECSFLPQYFAFSNSEISSAL